MVMVYSGPKKVIVGYNTTKIVPHTFSEKETAKFADFDSWTYEIRISNDDMSHDILRQTVLHELIHAIEYGNVSTKRLTEVQVEQLSAGLYGLIRDNPSFIKWIQEAPRK
jgi:hypothetical protein